MRVKGRRNRVSGRWSWGGHRASLMRMSIMAGDMVTTLSELSDAAILQQFRRLVVSLGVQARFRRLVCMHGSFR